MQRDDIETFANHIGGRWDTEPETMPALNPATDEPIGRLPRSSRETARRAIAAARAAQPGWAATPVWQRAKACLAIAAQIDGARDRIARTLSLEQGKPFKEAHGEVGKAADGFRLAAELVKQLGGETLPAEDPSKLVLTLRQPRGVYAVITPWNFPVNIPVEYLAPGIATGNAIVWVPAPTTSMAAVELMRVIEEAGLPPGVVNLVIGEGAVVGDEIVAHPDTSGIGFTGSPATGQRIAERGAGKPMLLSWAATGRCWCSRTRISTAPPWPPPAAPSSMPARSALPPAGSWPIAASSSRWRSVWPRSPGRTSWGTRCSRAPPWDR